MMSNLLIFLLGWIVSVIIFIVLKTRHNKVKTDITNRNEHIADVTEEGKE